MSKKAYFFLYLGGAFLLSYLPFIHLPFTWTQTFFHEISHGIIATLTGGTVEHIEIHIAGSGLCFYSGGSRFLTAFSGYFGACLIGLLIYLSASNSHPVLSRFFCIALGSLPLIAALLWGRDLTTWIILLIISGLCFLPLIRQWQQKVVHSFVHLLGMYVLLDAIKSPLHLIDGRKIGDGSTLARLTHLPELFWVAVWLMCGLGCLWVIWRFIQTDETSVVEQ